MGWTYIGYCKNYNQASGTTLAGDVTLDVQAGDLLVAICLWYGADTTATISDGAGNDLTMMAHQYISSDRHCYGYKIAASASSSATFTLTLGAAREYRVFILLQFRPSAGTVSLDAYDLLATATSAAVQSDNITTTGTDELVIGGHMIDSSTQQAISDCQIGDVAADGVPYSSTYYCHLWYKAFDSVQTDIHAQGTLAASARWGAGILAFKLTPSGTTYTLACGAGSFALAGQASALKAIRRIALSPGALSLSGQPVGLRASRRTIAGAGVFSLQGQPIGLKAARRLSAAPGAFALAGLPAFLRRVARLVLGPGAFALTGQDVDLRLGGAVPVIPTLHIAPWRYTPAQSIRLRAHATFAPFEVTNTIRIPGGSS